MNITHKEGQFVAEITGSLLTVRHARRSVFTCRLRPFPWFVVRSDGLYVHNALTPLYRGEDADTLLTCLTGVLAGTEKRRAARRWLTGGVAAVALASVAWVSGLSSLSLPSGSASELLMNTHPHSVLNPGSAGSRPLNVAGNTHIGGALPAPVAARTTLWPLPAAVRAGLPARLEHAAARGVFTVPMSAGHARTLYVFADPQCPNCQRMERLFEAASDSVNVEIFPVTVEGGAASLAALAPVMALPLSQRPAAWKQLFSADAGVGVPGSVPVAGVKTPDAAALEMARAAVGVNEVAFRAYRLPGTPWTISDDGRYVPQAALASPEALQRFLTEGDMHDGQ
ncbi:thioredoxin fold domain-containing protein [Rahnella sp. BCC 1045]|uniref:thioredoxin fold domain-containing protein n=1 Tax=Rahnella sp. BCC 1045 TaxID=2816251 RepID=UPI001C2529F4|nr:thioredoxin fold domain-containing protein [Rahnella sp. BCC 1045]MBU9819646.1 thioredoxin fold domain-containing protein [Rahnella sp. BCC 1045]